MFNVCGFCFRIVPDPECDDLRFVIDYWINGDHSCIFLDSVRAWIDEATEKLSKGMTAEQVIDDFFSNKWKEIQDAVMGYWKERKFTVDEMGFWNEVIYFRAALRVLTEGIARDKNLPIKPEPDENPDGDGNDASPLKGWDTL